MPISKDLYKQFTSPEQFIWSRLFPGKVAMTDFSNVWHFLKNGYKGLFSRNDTGNEQTN